MSRKIESRRRRGQIFKKTASRIHKKNLPVVNSRGGIRL